MTRKEQIMRLSVGRAHLGTFLNWFEALEDWEKYLQCAVIFHDYDKLLKTKLKEKNT
jgi:hypothetical protein